MKKYILILLVTIIFSSASFACNDSDMGKVYNESGYVSIVDSISGEILVLSDRCSSDSVSENKRLEEYYCDNKGKHHSVFTECSVLCYDGRCITEEEKDKLYSCKDSDFGKDISLKGNVTGRVSFSSSVGQFSDYCVLGFTDQLMEYYCNADGFVSVELITCDSECIEGKCIGSLKQECEEGIYIYYKTSYSDNVTDAACCDKDACVYGGTCYNSGTVIKIDDEYTPCASGFWLECDSKDTVCNQSCRFNWVHLGEDHFIGEYYQEIYGCCGDDLGEYFIIGVDNSTACCDNPTDLVLDNVCIENKESIKNTHLSYHFDDTEVEDVFKSIRSQNNTDVIPPSEDISSDLQKKSDTNHDSFPKNNVSLFSRLFGFFLNLFK
jgi:hypothetical protein